MSAEGRVSEEERREAEEAEVQVHPVDDSFRETSPFYVETVRRQIVDRYSNDRLLHDGLRVEMAMDLEKQRAAQAAMLKGLMEVDHRQGYYGPVLHLDKKDERQAFESRLAAAWPKGSLKVGDYAVALID